MFLGFTIAMGIGFSITNLIRERQYETAKMYNTAVQADEAERFNYAIDSRQGNLLGSGIFTAKDTVTIEELAGEYFRIEKDKERYTRHTETYSCGTEESPRTCTRTYYTWDYAGGDEFVSQTLVLYSREYPSSLFSVSLSRRLDCDVIKIDCKDGYRYEENRGFWGASVGDIRWYYKVVDTSFFGTILASTLGGSLEPVNESRITIHHDKDIPSVLKDVNNTSGPKLFLAIYIMIAILICGFTFKEQVYES